MTDRPAGPAAPSQPRRRLPALALLVLIAAGALHLFSSGPPDASDARQPSALQAAQPYCAQPGTEAGGAPCGAAPSTDRDGDGEAETIIPHQRNPAPAGGIAAAPTPDQAEDGRYPNPGGAR